MDLVIGQVLVEIGYIPAASARDLETRKNIDAQCRAARERLAKFCDDKAREFEADAERKGRKAA